MLDIIGDFWLFAIILALIAGYKVFKSRIKGAIGEQTVAWRLSGLPKSKYRVINNVVLKVGEKTTQIDHLVVSNYGLFVIETKNLIGWIFGYENSEYWTQVIFKRKDRFYNPIRQNRGHIKALRLTLSEFSDVNYIPIVTFSGSCTLKVDVDSDVIYSSELLKTIRSYSDLTLSDSEKEAICAKITLMNISGTYNRSKHINDIRKRISEKEDSIGKNICPQCGADLISRKGVNGRFRGCSNYPRCKFTTSIY